MERFNRSNLSKEERLNLERQLIREEYPDISGAFLFLILVSIVWLFGILFKFIGWIWVSWFWILLWPIGFYAFLFGFLFISERMLSKNSSSNK